VPERGFVATSAADHEADGVNGIVVARPAPSRIIGRFVLPQSRRPRASVHPVHAGVMVAAV
jgi:hypothetical protein